MNLKTIRFEPLGSPTHPFFLPLNEQLFNAVVPPAWRCMLLTKLWLPKFFGVLGLLAARQPWAS
jgi:hypothetical protein